ncbi:MAG: permease-like cell division protein FtsX [Gemmatimonadales bacterium]
MSLAMREALLGFRRAPVLSALSVTTIAFALFVVGLFSLVALNLQAALDRVGERVEVVMYLRRGTPVEATVLAMDDIQRFPEVARVEFVTEEEALLRAREELTEFRDIFDEFRDNPLPASLQVHLLPEHRNATTVAVVADRLRGFRFAEDVRYGGDWVENLDRLRGIAGGVGLLVGLAFAMTAVIIIGTTIRMTVLQRNREIQIMRLVGATDGFIRLPFLLEGALKGALGGLAAVGLNYAALLAVSRVLADSRFFTLPEAGAIVLFGTALGFLASAVAVRRHLRRV